MSPRHKSRHTPSSSSSTSPSSTTTSHGTPLTTPPKETTKPIKTSTPIPTTSTTTTTGLVSNQSSVPTLPDVHSGKATPGGLPVGNFLHTLLSEEQQKEEEMENAGRFQENGSRSVAVGRGSKTKGKVVREGYGRRLNLPERLERRFSGETLTARSNRILTASWAGSGDTTDSNRRGQRRQHSKDNTGSSTRRLSGVLPSKKKFKPKLSVGNNNSSRQSVDLQMKSLPQRSPVPGDFTETEDAVPASEDQVDIAVEEEEDSVSDSVRNPSRSEKWVESTVIASVAKEESDCVPEYPGVDSSEWVSQPAPSGLRMAHSTEGTDMYRHSKQTSPLASTEVVTTTEVQQKTPSQGSEQLTKTTTTSSTTTTTTQPPEPFSQWTTCRALENTDDDDDELNDEDDDEDALGCSRTSEELHKMAGDSSMVDGRCSRMTSGNPTRRKRPLLLPPIMLPPVYSVKPTPLVLRDDVYFATSGARARRPMTDNEWDKLRDCRYLRIRTMRRPLKV